MNRLYYRLRQTLVRRNQRRLDRLLPELAKITKDPRVAEIIEYRERYGPAMIPLVDGRETGESAKSAPIKRDGEWRYTEWHGTRIFWPPMLSEHAITDSFATAVTEQHPSSPHRYEHDPSSPLQGDWAILVGASDCYFAATIAARFRKLIVLEPDPRWRATMERTLRYAGVEHEIVPFFAGSSTNGNAVTLDSLVSGSEERVSFIQTDVEGAELDVLFGAERILSTHRTSASICCYHTSTQAQEVWDFLSGRGYDTRYSPGYLDPMTPKRLVYP